MFFERPDSGEVAILIHVNLEGDTDVPDPDELKELVLSAGAHPVELITASRKSIDSRTFVGSGKVAEIADTIAMYEADVVIFNHALSPSQERNLEKALKCRVLDRTGLILDIFAQRARSYEGKLQVELAQMQHQLTRLIRGWTHLDRQKGGIGMRGVGETQLEIDQRLVRTRIRSINKSLEKVRKQREQNRRSRKKAEIPTVSLVGYTNAGKSSLFNRLSSSDIYVADQLFATLDSTLRRIVIPDLGPVILADTVGFIRNLPHQLVDAFRATLEETTNASLLLHVVDCNSEERDYLKAEVEEVLAEIDAADIPTLLVFNKVDLLGYDYATIDRDENGKPWRVWVSALTGAGIEHIFTAIAELLGGELVDTVLELAPDKGRLRASLYKLGVVRDESVDETGNMLLSLRLPREDLARLVKAEGLPMPELPPSSDTDRAEEASLNT